jgi:hypothetical protein
LKAAVLTNPLRNQDRVVVTAFNEIAENPGIVVPDSPVKIEIIKDNRATYPVALTKALNIYTLKNNYCFWDNGDKGANVLIGAGEGENKVLLRLPPNTTKLELVVSKEGDPSFTTPSEDKRSLDFKILAQGRLFWCWAATSASIADYYEKGQTWTPCKVANRVLGRTDCCGVGGVNCDKAIEFTKALETMGHWEKTGSSGLTLSGIKAQIDQGRPILAGLAGLKGLPGHGVVITGYDNSNPKKATIEVQDSEDASKTICDFDTFPRAYGLGYTWVVTCYTK